MNYSVEKIWQQTLAEMSNSLTKPSFETWLKCTRAVSLQDHYIVVEVPNDFTKEWFETRYRDLIKSSLKKITSKNYNITFVVRPTLVDVEETEEQQGQAEVMETTPKPVNDSNSADSYITLFNPRYTFETFVVGSCNRLSHAASRAVAETPSRAYNPLFIYGGVGLGKTHLLHAIGQYIIKNYGLPRVFYFSSEKFTNEFINAIRDNKTLEFRNKYRNIDVLLIDDIQFLAKKEQTQEEFFHTFNALHDNNRQIVISSDRPPKEIPTLEDRLRSRFEWGLITDIQTPDLETRIAILRKKAQSDGLTIPDEVVHFIAAKIETNIRELEGALIRIVAYASLAQEPMSLKVTEEALKGILFRQKKDIYIRDIIRITASHFNLSSEELRAKKRTQEVALARQFAMYLAREMTDLSLPKVGEEFGGRDHTTVLHSFRKVKQITAEKPELKQKLETIRNDILHNA